MDKPRVHFKLDSSFLILTPLSWLRGVFLCSSSVPTEGRPGQKWGKMCQCVCQCINVFCLREARRWMSNVLVLFQPMQVLKKSPSS